MPEADAIQDTICMCKLLGKLATQHPHPHQSFLYPSPSHPLAKHCKLNIPIILHSFLLSYSTTLIIVHFCTLHSSCIPTHPSYPFVLLPPAYPPIHHILPPAYPPIPHILLCFCFLLHYPPIHHILPPAYPPIHHIFLYSFLLNTHPPIHPPFYTPSSCPILPPTYPFYPTYPCNQSHCRHVRWTYKYLPCFCGLHLEMVDCQLRWRMFLCSSWCLSWADKQYNWPESACF